MATVPAARTPQVAQTAVRRDKRAGTELEAAAGSEYAGVHVSYPIASRNLVTAAFAAESSPAIGRALRSGAPAGRASEARCHEAMLLNTLPSISGRSSTADDAGRSVRSCIANEEGAFWEPFPWGDPEQAYPNSCGPAGRTAAAAASAWTAV